MISASFDLLFNPPASGNANDVLGNVANLANLNVSVEGASVSVDSSQLENLQAETIVITEAPVAPTTTVTEKQFDATMLYKCDKCVKLEIYNDYLLTTLTDTNPTDLTSLEKQYYTVFRLYIKDFVR